MTVLLVPPVNLAVLGLVAALLAWRSARPGALVRAVRSAGALCLMALVILSVPAVGMVALASLDPGGVPAPVRPPAAIVILGGDVARLETPALAMNGPLTLERLRAGAALHRATGLPILVTGGIVGETAIPVGTLMADSLAQDFAVTARWTEAVSFDTWENADLSARMLAQDGIRSVFLVTHAWHMRRALLAFRRHGIEAVPAPVRPDPWPAGRWQEFVPRVSAWQNSYFGLHEWVGLAWYAFRR